MVTDSILSLDNQLVHYLVMRYIHRGKKKLYIKPLSPRKTLTQAVNMLLFIIIYNTKASLNRCKQLMMHVVSYWTTQGLCVGDNLNMHCFSAPSKP